MNRYFSQIILAVVGLVLFATPVGAQEVNAQSGAEQEKNELAVIEEFLPQQMGEAETKAAIEKIKAETGAEGMKDMGRVMGELKARHGTQLDMGRASGWVKESLS